MKLSYGIGKRLGRIQLQEGFHLPHYSAYILTSVYLAFIGAADDSTGLSARYTAHIIAGVRVSDSSLILTSYYQAF